MLRLGLPREPYWLDLPLGVRLKVRPLTTAVMHAARSRARRQAAELREDRERLRETGADLSHLPDLEDEDAVAGLAETFLVKALARYGVLAWEGVLDAEGSVLPVAPEAVDELMDVQRVADAFLQRYTAPLEAALKEGEGSGPAPNGTTATGPATATGAGGGGSPARGAKRDRAASAAPTSSTPR